jgi:hypothetical protein
MGGHNPPRPSFAPTAATAPTGRYSELAAWALDPSRTAPAATPANLSTSKSCLCTNCLAAPRTRSTTTPGPPPPPYDPSPVLVPAPEKKAVAPAQTPPAPAPARPPTVGDYARFLRTPRWQLGNLPCFLAQDTDGWTHDRHRLALELRRRGLPQPFEEARARARAWGATARPLDDERMKDVLLPEPLRSQFDELFPDSLRSEWGVCLLVCRAQC